MSVSALYAATVLLPYKDWGYLPPGSRFFANTFGSNKGTQSKRGDFS